MVASNPEFLREGAAIRDFKFPDRIVVGTSDERARKVIGDIYRPLSLNQAPLMFTTRRTAELIKYAANAFLATKITFINEMADLAEKVGADVQEIARGIGLDNRIGPKFLHAGPGFGGSCFPKDARALLQIALDHDVPLRITEAVIGVNDNRKRAMARKVANAVGGNLRGRTIAVLGLTFKPDTDDMREAPSIPLVTGLLDMGAKVRAHDPVGMEQARRELPDIEYCDDPYVCARGADALVIVTEWVQFRALDLERLKREMAQPVIVDLRNIYRPEEMAALGFTYESVGRSGVVRRFSPPLPIDAALDELTRALEKNNAAVLVAPPGAGKTTRVPLALLDAAWLSKKKIIMLEPRRIAARASAERMAQTLGRTRRRNRRLSRALRLENIARNADRGGHRRDLLAADSRRSGVVWRCRGAVRRISRALARRRSWALRWRATRKPGCARICASW